jgi:hypothetical protein
MSDPGLRDNQGRERKSLISDPAAIDRVNPLQKSH